MILRPGSLTHSSQGIDQFDTKQETTFMAQDILNRKTVGRTAVAALLLSSWISPVTASSIEEAINKAGKQRMITQRVLMEYALSGMNLQLGHPEEELKKLIGQFDDSLADLKAFTDDPGIQASLAKITKLWQPLKKTLEDTPDKSRAHQLQTDIDKLLAACEENTRLFETLGGSPQGEIVALAGRQRMLSQRMGALYLLKAWHINQPYFHEQLAEAMADFSQAHQRLEASPLTTDEIRELLARVKKSYAWFEMMGKSQSGRFIPSLIVKSANNILADMDKATNLYAGAKK